MRRGKEVRVGAKCKHCKKLYYGLSSGGTGHLTRHIPKCPVLKGRRASGAQSLLQFNSDGSVANWEYSPEVARVQLVRLIARLDLPLGFGESEAFDDYITNAHNPRFTPCSRQTTTRDLTKYFNERRDKLMDTLKTVSSVALTSDIWSSNAKKDYLSVVAHFINSDWQLEKRILGMRLIDCSHNAENIAGRVACVASDFGISNKIFFYYS